MTALRWTAEAAGRALVLAALWWVVSEGSPLVGWQFAAPVVAAATAAGLWVRAPRRRRRPRPVALAAAVAWFLGACVLEGTRVALRALRPGAPVEPVVVTYRLQDPHHEDLAVLLADVVSVLPGTLVLRIDPGELRVHVLDRDRLDIDGLVALERRLAACYGGPPAPR